MSRARDILAVGALCLLIPVANAQNVVPGRFFPGEMLNIRAPDSDGWRLIGSSSIGMAFFSGSESAGDTYLAEVKLFAPSKSRKRDDFLAFVRTTFEKNSPRERFRPLESSYEYTEERSYPCVRVTAVVQDTKAFFGRESLRLQWHSLYCLHPKRQDAGFMIAYSHRGVSMNAEFDAKARAFIQGVQVPE